MAGVPEVVAEWIASAGLVPATGRAGGDILILNVAPFQIHVAIDAGDGIVHAHAGLGRVVRMALPDDWRTLERWRVPD